MHFYEMIANVFMSKVYGFTKQLLNCEKYVRKKGVLL